MFTAYAGACHSIASPSGAPKASQQAKNRRKNTQKAQAAEDVARMEARDAESANQAALWRQQIMAALAAGAAVVEHERAGRDDGGTLLPGSVA